MLCRRPAIRAKGGLRHLRHGLRVPPCVRRVVERDDGCTDHGACFFECRTVCVNRRSQSCSDEHATLPRPPPYRTHQVGRNIQAFRMRLWNHHLGLPPHSVKTKDFAADKTWEYLTKLAEENTLGLHEAFPGVFPHNSYQTWKTPTVKDAAGRKIGDALHPGFVDDRIKAVQTKREAVDRGKTSIKKWEVRFYSSLFSPSPSPSPSSSSSSSCHSPPHSHTVDRVRLHLLSSCFASHPARAAHQGRSALRRKGVSL